ncbi:MAG: PilN domain-containing protein [Chloroflexota bacterium]
MAKKTVTLYIDDTSLRLMVTQGSQIKEWAESPLEPGLVEDNVVIKEAEVAARIKQLFEVQEVTSKQIALGLSGRCFTRPIAFPKLPKEMLDEAVRREAPRVLPVPLEEIYLSWQTIPSSAEQTQVFIVGLPRTMVDTLFRVLQQAGLRVSFMETKPLLLTRIVKETAAIIVDVQAKEFDIAVMVGGIPHPVRSIRFASGALSSNEKLTTIRSELTRSLAFYNTTYPEKPLAPSVPVFISGNLANEPELYQPLSQEFGHPVLPLPSPLECPEGLDPGHYMANIGLAFQATSAKEKPGATAITLNALPAAYRTRTVSLANVLVLPGAIVAISLLAFLVVFNQSVSADIASINTRLSNTTTQLQQKQAQQRTLSAKITELQKKVEGVKASRDGLTEVLGILEKQAEATDRDLAAALEALPQSVNMSSIRHISNVLTITGISPDEKQLSSYIAKLDRSGRFGNVAITEMTRNESGKIDFTLVGTLQAQTIGASSMEVALGSLPTGVNLTNVNPDKGTLAIDGVAPNADKVFSYLKALEASGKFTEITVTRMTSTPEGKMSFSLVLKTGE